MGKIVLPNQTGYLKKLKSLKVSPTHAGSGFLSERHSRREIGLVFSVSSQFENKNVHTFSKETGATSAVIYDVIQDGLIRELFNSLRVKLNSLEFQTEQQIKTFLEENENLLFTEKSRRERYFLLYKDIMGKRRILITYRHGYGSGRTLEIYLKSFYHKRVLKAQKDFDFGLERIIVLSA